MWHLATGQKIACHIQRNLPSKAVVGIFSMAALQHELSFLLCRLENLVGGLNLQPSLDYSGRPAMAYRCTIACPLVHIRTEGHTLGGEGRTYLLHKPMRV